MRRYPIRRSGVLFYRHEGPCGEWELLINAMRSGDNPPTELLKWLDLLLPGRPDHEPFAHTLSKSESIDMSHAIRDVDPGMWRA